MTKTRKQIQNYLGNTITMVTPSWKYVPKFFNCNEYRYMLKEFPKKKELKPGANDLEKKHKEVIVVHVSDNI